MLTDGMLKQIGFVFYLRDGILKPVYFLMIFTNTRLDQRAD